MVTVDMDRNTLQVSTMVLMAVPILLLTLIGAELTGAHGAGYEVSRSPSDGSMVVYPEVTPSRLTIALEGIAWFGLWLVGAVGLVLAQGVVREQKRATLWSIFIAGLIAELISFPFVVLGLWAITSSV